MPATSKLVLISRDDLLVIANSLNLEASHFDSLIEERGERVPRDTIFVWKAAAEERRALTVKLLNGAL